MVLIKEGIGNAAPRGCRKPKPPLEIGRVAMWVAIVKEYAGKDSIEKVPVMKLYQSSLGRSDSSVLTTSEAKSLDIWKLSQNSVEPMGKPKMWRPSVTLTGMPLLREYWLWFRRQREERELLELEEAANAAQAQADHEAETLAALENAARDSPFPLSKDQWTAHRVAEGPGGDRFAAVELFRAFRIFNPSYAKTLSHKDAFALIEKLDHYPIFRKGGYVAKLKKGCFDIPEEIITQYNLRQKVTDKGYIYVKATKGMYGLPQAGLLANELLEKRLNEAGYYQSKLVPGLWSHEWRPIRFSLVVDDFGVMYQGREHAEHLESVLKLHYPVKSEWDGKRYIGIFLDWDYTNRKVHLMKYGAPKQYAKEESTAPPLDKKGTRFIQQVCGKFLFLGRAVDSSLLVPISAIASQAANPTTDTLQQANQLLDYIATQEDAIITYSASDMVLNVHSDAGYLNETKARSRAGGHFFLSSNNDNPPNNGAILNIAHIIKNVMSSATEAELAALYITAREAVYIRIILDELGHKQPPTPLQTDNATAEGVVNNKIQPKL
ncbi:hypothetical protein QTG54_008223 [Skeletonema marinoi]|uniref:Reverse transcriptase Ty1/copia-type domain-containing protein n=1 Tax=Skeletonema marinoi TaxID=267567 RepID=A0AAD8Y908_9STRA|nr:hypothetical protein QTG54_008223 [Skeletonema marinoi]